MKRIFKSSPAKAAAFLLILICAGVFAGLIADMGDLFARGGYRFESSFEDSEIFQNMASIRFILSEDMESAARHLERLDYAEYYIEGGGRVFTNLTEYSSAEDAEEAVKSLPWWCSLENAMPENEGSTGEGDEAHLSVVTTDGDLAYGITYTTYEAPEPTYTESGNEWHSIDNDWPLPYKAYVGLKSEKYWGAEYSWSNSRRKMIIDIYIAAADVLLALALWIYLLYVCGRKNDDDEVHTLLIDRAFVEITAAAGIGGAFFLTLLSVSAMYEVIKGAAELMAPLSVLAAIAATGIFVATTQSLVRNMKNGTFVSRILCLKAVKYCGGLLIRVAKWLLEKGKLALNGAKTAFNYLCGNKPGRVMLALFGVYSLVLAFLCAIQSFLFIAVIAVGGVFLYRYLVQLDKIDTGISQIRSGNTDYKIEGCTTELLANAAEALNSINEGVKIGVEREVKAQRMKSELITNVSHDLKTPLTSIISYADLLAGMELSPKEANDYAKIIKQKGDRLKKLTSDLFDVSKAESGNETVNIEKLDICLLLRQSLGELNNEIENSGLSFVTSIPENETFVNADGKKLSRVFENLIVNAVKYSMKGTRVYVKLTETAESAIMEIKNISSAPLNFEPEEITERFVRGDASRTTEGSGLGLAIVKSYTELCGGKFAISVDGDLFKASVELNKAR